MDVSYAISNDDDPIFRTYLAEHEAFITTDAGHCQGHMDSSSYLEKITLCTYYY